MEDCLPEDPPRDDDALERPKMEESLLPRDCMRLCCVGIVRSVYGEGVTGGCRTRGLCVVVASATRRLILVKAVLALVLSCCHTPLRTGLDDNATRAVGRDGYVTRMPQAFSMYNVVPLYTNLCHEAMLYLLMMY